MSASGITKRALDLFEDECGSATLEFVMLALPLFIPLALYLNSVNQVMQNAQTLANLARQTARAFITSPSEDLAPVRAQQVLDAFSARDLAPTKATQRFSLSIACQSQPCITPNSKVTISVRDLISGREGSASQIVDSWRSSE